MNGLSWTRPELWPFLLLLPLLWVLLRWSLGGRARRAWLYGADCRERGSGPAARASVLTVLAGLSLVTWMDPLYGEEQVAVERRGLDLILCLDTSRSMLARDLEPNRLQRAITDIRAVLPELTGGDRVGLVVFAGEARLRVPLTHDLDSFRELLVQVDTDVIPVGGSDLASALRVAGEIADEREAASTAVVLLTDGEDLGGHGKAAAEELAGRDIVVHAIGYGSTRGSKITVEKDGEETFLTDQAGDEVVTVMDAEGLRELAESTGGEFLRADAMPLPLLQLQEKRLEPMVERAYEAGMETAKKTRYQWVLLPVLLLLLWEIATAGGSRR